MLVSMTLSLTQGHSGSEKAKILFQIIWTTKQATSIKLATTVGHFLCDLDFASATVYMAWPVLFFFPLKILISFFFFPVRLGSSVLFFLFCSFCLIS